MPRRPKSSMLQSRPSASASTACSRSLVPHGGDDRVWTPDALAVRIVSHYQPTGTILEPCKGQGSFLRALPVCDWCEIDEGRDFLAVEGRWDWIVTNPPWSQFRPFLAKSMQVAENVVFLVTMNHFFTKARMREVANAGFGFVEALLVETPSEPWPQSGFQVAAVHLRKGYNGPMAFSYENAESCRLRGKELKRRNNMPEGQVPTVGQPQVGSDDLLVPFETLPLGARMRYPGGDQVWTVLSKFRDNQDERLSGTLAEWRSDMGTLGYWPGQNIVSHLPADCPELVIFVG